MSAAIKPAMPYWQLSSFYFFYFAVIGAVAPYWPVYLQDRGFTAKGIGILVAVMMASRIVAPYVWGTLADKADKRMPIVRTGALMAMIFFAAMFVHDNLYWFALLLAVHSFFWNAVLSQYEVVTLDHLGTRSQDYSRIRLWGSVGFIISVVGLGAIFDWIAISWLPAFILVLIAFVWLSSLVTVDAEKHHTQARATEKIGQLLRQPRVYLFFLVCLLMQASHGPYYTFFSLYMEQHGHSRTMVGQLWALGVVAEIALFLYMNRWMPQFGIRFFILLSLVLASVRWILLALCPDVLFMLLFAQCLHAFSFGAFHVAGIELVRRLFPPAQAGRGQALYNAFGFGLGTVLGALTSGYLWEWSNRWTFLIAAMASAVGFVIAWRGVKVPPPRSLNEDNDKSGEESASSTQPIY